MARKKKTETAPEVVEATEETAPEVVESGKVFAVNVIREGRVYNAGDLVPADLVKSINPKLIK